MAPPGSAGPASRRTRGRWPAARRAPARRRIAGSAGAGGAWGAVRARGSDGRARRRGRVRGRTKLSVADLRPTRKRAVAGVVVHFGLLGPGIAAQKSSKCTTTVAGRGAALLG